VRLLKQHGKVSFTDGTGVRLLHGSRGILGCGSLVVVVMVVVVYFCGR